MAKRAKNKYSVEAGDPFSLGSDPMMGDGGGGDMGMGGGMDMGGGFGGGFGGGTTNPSNGLKPQDNIAVRGMKRLRKLLGIAFPRDIPKLKPDKRINLFAYTPDELKYQPGFAPNGVGTDYQNHGTPSDLYDYINRTVQQNASWEKEAKSSNILSPEIDGAKEIMAASIMSPVDLQPDNVNIIVDETGLSSEIEEKLSSMFTDYFNKEIHLGKRMNKWIGKALYVSGATPVLILPPSNIRTLNDVVDADEYANGRDPSTYLHGIKPTTRPKDSRISSGEALDPTRYMGSFEQLGIKADSQDEDAFLEKISTECIASIERNHLLADDIDGKKIDAIISKRGEFKKDMKQLLENGKNFIVFSSDPSIIKKHGDDLKAKTDRMQKAIDDRLLFGKVNPTYLLNTQRQEDLETEAAAIIELPYQSVVPVIVPGAPEQHVGYFVAVNQWGEPVNPDARDVNAMNMSSRIMESNMQATFGLPSGLTSQMGNSTIEKFKTTSVIFGIMLRNFMEHKLEEYGLGGTQIEQHEAITACLFRNLLDKKKIGLVFVPEPMMVYYRYMVHDDGTGKSFIEDIRTITGLRTTLVTAGVMAATENSIDQKIIELNVDEKNANVQQMLEQVKNAFIEKRIMRYDNNPLNVQRDLIQKSLMLVPKGMKGLQDSINISTDHKSQGSIMPDDGLLKQLTDWTIQGLKVPQAALNKTNEDDYARSVVTTNLFFNNRVKNLQLDTNEHTTKLIRVYIKYSTILQDKIMEILKSTHKDEEEYSTEAQELSPEQKEKEQKKAEKIRKTDTHPHQSDTKIETENKSLQQSLLDVIDHVYCKLPEPRIVVDKAQYEEINGFANCMNDIVDKIYSEDLLPDSMQEYKGTLAVLKARVKEQLLRDFIKNVGFRSAFDLPSTIDIDLDDTEELMMQMINYRRGLENIKEQVGDKVFMTGQEQSGGGFGGGDMSGGGGFGGDMTVRNAGGGFSDMGGTDNGADMNMESTGSTNESTAEAGGETNGEPKEGGDAFKI